MFYAPCSCGWEQVYVFFIPTNIKKKKSTLSLYEQICTKDFSWMRPNVVLDPTDLDKNNWNIHWKYLLLCSKNVIHSDRIFTFGWTSPLTGLRVPLQSSQLAVQWSAWFLAGWKSASECESSSCGKGGERANCFGRISPQPLLGSEMKGDDVRLFPHRITQCPSQCFSCSSRKPDKNNMPQWHPQDYIYLENPQKQKTKKKNTPLVPILICNSMLQRINAFTSSRHYDSLKDRQEFFSVLKALKGNAERSKPNTNDERRKRGP